MTTIITRLYDNEQTAHGVAQALRDHSFRDTMMDVISSSSDIDAAMAAARVPAGARSAYGEGIKSGKALMVVRAPFGGAERAHILMDQTPSVDMGDLKQSAYEPGEVSNKYRSSSIIKGSPRLMSSPTHASIQRGRPLLAQLWGKPLMKKRVNLDNALYRGTKYFANFPIPHLKKRSTNIERTLYRGTKYFANFPIPHLTKRVTTIESCVFRGTKYFANFPIPHLANRD
ncbi:MAG: hypothetical protein AAFN27_10580 [Pseudomonadota bacterium]